MHDRTLPDRIAALAVATLLLVASAPAVADTATADTTAADAPTSDAPTSDAPTTDVPTTDGPDVTAREAGERDADTRGTETPGAHVAPADPGDGDPLPASADHGTQPANDRDLRLTQASPRPNPPFALDDSRGGVVSYGPTPLSPGALSGAPGRGLTIRVDDRFSLNIRSRILARHVVNTPAPEVSADGSLDDRDWRQQTTIGTARLWFFGNVFRPEITWMIQLAVAGRDYRDGTTSPIFDAYMDWAFHRDFRMRVGQFFVPFDRLRTVREWALQLAERPRPVQELTLDRDVGIMLYSDTFLGDDSPIAWRLGVFGGGGANTTGFMDPGGLLVGRLEYRPLGPIDDDQEGDLLRRERPALALGAGYAVNINTDRVRSTTGARFQLGSATFHHIALDATFKWRGFALQLAHLWKLATEDEIEGTAADGSRIFEATRSGRGWVAQASYVFERPVELVGRASQLAPVGATDPLFIDELDRLGRELAFGVNYYVNGHRMKIQADWIARLPDTYDLRQGDHSAYLQLDVTF